MGDYYYAMKISSLPSAIKAHGHNNSCHRTTIFLYCCSVRLSYLWHFSQFSIRYSSSFSFIKLYLCVQVASKWPPWTPLVRGYGELQKPLGAQVWESSEDDSLASVDKDDSLASVDPITGASWTIRGAAVGPPVASLLAALGGTSAGGSAAWTPFVSLLFSLFIVPSLFSADSADSGRFLEAVRVRYMGR